MKDLSVRFCLNRNPDDFRNWLRQEVLPLYSVAIPHQDPPISVLPAEWLPNSVTQDTVGKLITGTLGMDAFSPPDSGGRYRVYRIHSGSEALEFKVVRIAPDRIEVTARCLHPALRDCFVKLLGRIAETSPEARAAIFEAYPEAAPAAVSEGPPALTAADSSRADQPAALLDPPKLGRPPDLLPEAKKLVLEHLIRKLRKEGIPPVRITMAFLGEELECHAGKTIKIGGASYDVPPVDYNLDEDPGSLKRRRISRIQRWMRGESSRAFKTRVLAS